MFFVFIRAHPSNPRLRKSAFTYCHPERSRGTPGCCLYASSTGFLDCARNDKIKERRFETAVADLEIALP
jgi:hypothetical protein